MLDVTSSEKKEKIKEKTEGFSIHRQQHFLFYSFIYFSSFEKSDNNIYYRPINPKHVIFQSDEASGPTERQGASRCINLLL
jgi:hypothetical protein